MRAWSSATRVALLYPRGFLRASHVSGGRKSPAYWRFPPPAYAGGSLVTRLGNSVSRSRLSMVPKRVRRNGVSRTCVPKRSLGTRDTRWMRDTRYRTAGFSASFLDRDKHTLEVHRIRELLPCQSNDAVVGGGTRF